MTNSFLEDQARARGMTVSEMMKKRGELANKSKSGFASMDKEKLKAVASKGGLSAAQARKGDVYYILKKKARKDVRVE